MIWPLASLWPGDAVTPRRLEATAPPKRAPRIAVVVTCTKDVATLSSCLTTIAGCCRSAGAEVIVVAAKAALELGSVAAEFPFATIVSALEGTPATELRRIGLGRASSNLIVFVDDFATERREWTATFCSAWHSWADGGGRVDRHPCAAPSTTPLPQISVVMPVRNGEEELTLALEAIQLTDLPRHAWELVVVNDASDDGSEAIAARFADKLVRLPKPARGPGYARNRGFETTLGDYIAFINADVMVRPDTLRHAITAMLESPDIGAVVGCYDIAPRVKGLVSQYRNLLQHHYASCTPGDRAIFSSACCVMSSDVFEAAGGYDEWHFRRRQLEDLDLGQQIRVLGYRTVLTPEIQATHLKEWTLRSLITTEIFDRAVPRMRLLRSQEVLPTDVGARHERTRKHVNTALTWASLVFVLAATRTRQPLLLVPAVICLAAVAVSNSKQLAFFRQARGIRFAVLTLGLDWIHYLAAGASVVIGWVTREAVGEPRPGPSAEAFTEMGVKRWPPTPARRALARSTVTLASAQTSAPVSETIPPPTGASEQRPPEATA
jgi:GT2 family glycosyltransferase